MPCLLRTNGQRAGIDRMMMDATTITRTSVTTISGCQTKRPTRHCRCPPLSRLLRGRSPSTARREINTRPSPLCTPSNSAHPSPATFTSPSISRLEREPFLPQELFFAFDALPPPLLAPWTPLALAAFGLTGLGVPARQRGHAQGPAGSWSVVGVGRGVINKIHGSSVDHHETNRVGASRGVEIRAGGKRREEQRSEKTRKNRNRDVNASDKGRKLKPCARET